MQSALLKFPPHTISFFESKYKFLMNFHFERGWAGRANYFIIEFQIWLLLQFRVFNQKALTDYFALLLLFDDRVKVD